jgi:hypothetical protein
VPFGDFDCLLLPPDAEEKENGYVMLSDIFPTGYHATVLAGVEPGDSVVIYGAGPVRLMAALSAGIKGASKVMVVDSHPDRLRLAEKIGGIPIDDSDGSAVEQVLEMAGGEGADRGCECAGYQCSCKGHEVPNLTMNNLVKSVRATGHSRGGRVRGGRSEVGGQADAEGPARIRLRHDVDEGPAHCDGTGQRKGVQPQAARPDCGGQRETIGHCFA